MNEFWQRAWAWFVHVWFVVVVVVIMLAVILSAENPEGVIVIAIVLLGVLGWIVVQIDRGLRVLRMWLNGEVGLGSANIVHIKMGDTVLNNYGTEKSFEKAKQPEEK